MDRFRPRLETLESRHMLSVLGLGIRLFPDNNGTPGATEISSVKVGDTFWVEVFAEDQRANPPGVISLPLNLSWDSNIIELSAPLPAPLAVPFSGPQAVPTGDSLLTPHFPLDRFVQNFDPIAGHTGIPEPVTVTIAAPSNPNIAGLRGAAVPNALNSGEAIATTTIPGLFSEFRMTAKAASDKTPFTVQLAGSMSFADADALNGINSLINPPPMLVTQSPDSEGQSVTEFIDVTPVADLQITKDDGKTTVVPGTANSYTIIVTNFGPSTVTSVLVTDTLPPALLNPVFTPSVGNYDPTTHVWSGLSLATGQSVTMTLSGTIDPAATGSLTNQVTVAPPDGVHDPDSDNNSATDTDSVSLPTGISGLSGFVYADTNFNGVLDRDAGGQATEFGLPNVTITLSGAQSQVTTTGPDGAYHFVNLPPGTFNLVETLPAHFVHTSVVSPFGNSVGMILPDVGVVLPPNSSLGTPGPSGISAITLPDGAEGVDYNFGLNATPDKRFLLASTDIRSLLAGQLGVSAVTVAGTAGTPLTVSADSSQITVTGTTGGTQQFALSAAHEVIINANGADVTLNGTAGGEVADLSPGSGSSSGSGALRVGSDYTGAHFAILALGTQSVTANGTTGNDLAILRAPSGDALSAATATMATLTSADGQQALAAGFNSLDTVRAISLDDNDTSTVQTHNYILKLVGKWL